MLGENESFTWHKYLPARDGRRAETISVLFVEAITHPAKTYHSQAEESLGAACTAWSLDPPVKQQLLGSANAMTGAHAINQHGLDATRCQ